MSDQALVELIRTAKQPRESKIYLEAPISIKDYEYALYHIQEVTFDEDSPRKEAFENVLSSLSIEGIVFIYLLLNDGEKANFIFGIAKDKRYTGELTLDVQDIAKFILKPALEGNFRGSVVRCLEKEEREIIKNTIDSYNHVSKLDGIPSVNEDNEKFQGIDRLVDIMSEDRFCLAVLADPLSLTEINKIENQLYTIYDKLLPMSKKSIQQGDNSSQTVGQSEGSSDSTTTGQNDNISITRNTGKSVTFTTSTSKSGTSEQTSKSSAENDHSKHQSGSESNSKGTSTSKSVSKNIGSNKSEQIGNSSSVSREYSEKSIQEWITYIDDILLKRVQVGKNKGLYLSGIYLFSDKMATVLKLGNTARSIFSGGDTNKSPLILKEVTNPSEKKAIKNFQLPFIKQGNNTVGNTNNQQLDLLFSYKPFNRYLCNWLSLNELSVVAGLPQKEVVGLTLKEEVEFGLNVNHEIKENNKLYLGKLVKSGIEQKIEVNLDKSELDKHIFIAGVTGSGKTTTCQRLLESAQMPFLVIEPAKTEYRVLAKKNKNILIFTLGNDNVAPFRLNPFEFFPHENITSRVDMIKASIESAFDMEAAIPQLVEAAIYNCYEEKGWNIATSKNRLYEDPFKEGVYAFPTLSDLVTMTEVVVNKQGFDDRLKQDYIGSIRARLQGLLIGAKGLMLDTPRSINFKDLATKSVILELEEIRNPSEKSLVMGFVLANLNEAIRANYHEYKNRGDKYRHITLIEEAHRLLSKFEPGDSQNKKQGVETFADMLAEVRKYGESLIIVDQIPNKLTPEVLKNTNTKIIHKLFAKDDKEAVGNTMALSDEQKDFLSNLEPGRVILSSSGMSKPLQVQIEELVSTTNEEDVEPSKIEELALSYYAVNYKTGLIPGLEFLADIPSSSDVSDFMHGLVADAWYDTVGKTKRRGQFLLYLKKFGWEFMHRYICLKCYHQSSEKDIEKRKATLGDFLSRMQQDGEIRINLELDAIFNSNLKSRGEN